MDLGVIPSDWIPADPESASSFRGICGLIPDLTVLSRTSVLGGPADPYAAFVAADQSVMWGYPGQPDVVAVHIRLGIPEERIFAMSHVETYSIALAERWLVREHGVEPGDLVRAPGAIQPADRETREIEDRLRRSGDRFEVVHGDLDSVALTSTVLLRDTAPGAEPPWVVQVQWPDEGSGYRVREGRFPDEASARRWMDRRDVPLETVRQPSAPDATAPVVSRRAEAARPRTVSPPPAGPLAPPSRPVLPATRPDRRP